jgi:hypothetical protein
LPLWEPRSRLRAAGGGPIGARARGLIVVLWRAGLRISQALGLGEGDLDPARGAFLVRRGKGGKRREVGMGRVGLGAASPVARVPVDLVDRSALLRDQRTDPRATVVWAGDTDSASAPRGQSESQAPVRTASAAPRARG